MNRKDKKELYELLCDLACKYIDDNNIDFCDNQKGENDEVLNAIDSLKYYLEDELDI